MGHNQKEQSADVDVMIVGGGLIGLSLGLACGIGGLRVLIVDRMNPATIASAAYDGRTTALSEGTERLFRGIGVWDEMEPASTPIREIRISDGASPFYLHYDHRDLGPTPLGRMVENIHIRQVLGRAVERMPRIQTAMPDEVLAVERTALGVRTRLSSGRDVTARLVAACDGRGSPLRQEAGIRVFETRYGQNAIVTNVRHEKPHEGVAHERFLPAGPLAVLPLADAADGMARSSVVWTEESRRAAALLKEPRDLLERELLMRFGDWLGTMQIESSPSSYPLALSLAARMVDRRLALVGDAAHAVHPIAGQGFNLGARDVAALAEVLVDAHRLGLDIGNDSVLARYQRWRRVDTLVMSAVTDGINRLFSNSSGPLALARGVGLAAVHQFKPMRRFFMRHAMGTVGDLPRLIAGQPI